MERLIRNRSLLPDRKLILENKLKCESKKIRRKDINMGILRFQATTITDAGCNFLRTVATGKANARNVPKPTNTGKRVDTMTNEQLVARIRAGEDVSGNMLQLWQQVRSFIHVLAIRYQGIADMEDLEQEGYLALYPAIDGYDPDKGVLFLTYAEYHISQAMRRYVLMNRGNLHLSFRAHGLVVKYKQFCNAFLLQHGQEPSDRDAAQQMGLSVDQIREIRQNMVLDSMGSLDAALPDSEDITVGDTVPSGENLEGDAADRLDLELLRAVLWPMVDNLPDRQPVVIRMKYQQGMTLKEIGEVYGVTIETIRQSERRGMQALRRSRGARRLKAFLPETAEAQAYRGSSMEHFNQTWTSSTERVALQLSR